MQALANEGYSTLTADQFLGFLRGHNDVPARSVLITFDDGYLDNYVYAFPTMRRLCLHGVIFAVTSWIGEGPARTGQTLPCPNHKTCKAAITRGDTDQVMLRWSEIKEMEAGGAIEVHSHTHTHTRWDKQISNPQARLEKIREELADSRATLEAQLGRHSRHLCWPQGYFQPDYQEVARTLGYEVLYTTRRHLNTPKTSLQNIGRIVVKDKDGKWLSSRLRLYRTPLLGRLYTWIRGAD